MQYALLIYGSGDWSTLSEETIYIPLHHQMVAHAMKNDLDIPVRPDNWVYMKMTAAK